MFRNYLKVSLRKLYRNKLFTLFNIIGLAVGLASVIITGIFIKKELSYDRFFQNSDKIYRVITEFQGQKFAGSLYNIHREIKESFPEVKSSTLVFKKGYDELKYQNIDFGYFQRIFSNAEFFDVFSFNILEGDPRTKFNVKNTAIITKKVADKVFEQSSPINSIITLGEKDYTVVGVINDVPDNSHLQFDILLNVKTLDENHYLQRVGNGFITYFLLQSPINNKLEKKIIRELEKNTNLFYKDYSHKFSHKIQALTDIHLYSDFDNDLAETGSLQNVYIFIVVATLILFIAVFNFVNLSIVRYTSNLKDLAIRKILGATKKNIQLNYLTESILITLLSFLVGMLFVESLIGVFNNLIQGSIDIQYNNNYLLIIFFLLLSVVIGVIAALYPSIHLSKLNPLKILNNDKNINPGKNILRSFFVTLQFIITIVLITSVIGLIYQVNFMNNKDLGYNKKDVLIAYSLSSKIRNKYESIKNKLTNHPDIISVSSSMAVPGSSGNGRTMRLAEQSNELAFSINENLVKSDFVKTYGIEIIKGRDFSLNLESDKKNILVNETTVKKLGIKDPIGKIVYNGGFKSEIIGVFKDCHFQSLHHKIEPFVLSKRLERIYYLAIRFDNQLYSDKGSSLAQVVNYVGKSLNNFDPDYKFQYYFLEDRLNKQYLKEKNSAKLILSGSILAIIISSMGLFALTTFNLNRKTKEIGIRKVLGSTTVNLIFVFLSQSLKLILLAAFIALPISYGFLTNWFNNFAYHINFSFWFFILALIIILIISSVTILTKVIRAANTNPVDVLRYE